MWWVRAVNSTRCSWTMTWLTNSLTLPNIPQQSALLSLSTEESVSPERGLNNDIGTLKSWPNAEAHSVPEHCAKNEIRIHKEGENSRWIDLCSNRHFRGLTLSSPSPSLPFFLSFRHTGKIFVRQHVEVYVDIWVCNKLLVHLYQWIDHRAVPPVQGVARQERHAKQSIVPLVQDQSYAISREKCPGWLEIGKIANTLCEITLWGCWKGG